MFSIHPLISCVLLLVVCLSSSGESWPHVAHRSTPPAGDRADNQKAQLLEAVKMGILSSLGTDREPKIKQKATDQELRKMYQLYREKLREKRRNSSLLMSETRQSTVSTLLFPATVEAAKVPWRGERPQPARQWYRAVFHKNSHIHAQMTLVSAELKITRLNLNQPTTVQPEVNRDIRVKATGMRSTNLAVWTHADSVVHVNVSGDSGDVVLDLSPEVEEWMRGDDGQRLVVDVGVAVVDSDALKADPIISLALGLMQPKAAQRMRRSNKEDDCDEQGWCCRKSVTVSFKEIGWTDWVVAPTEYTMHFCDGTCPHNYKPASMHTQVKSRLHQITQGGTPRPCCVPAAYEPMVLMHYDSKGKLKLTPFDDFIVSKCHCA
ncbi:inhibin beta C chain [Solea solea]|uniref:inhibin beta C chain n=1 Tax=Solea solea TaxID=90069 RepID=UPI00272CB042|nr:inhibin beta C chain [Solea solea]